MDKILLEFRESEYNGNIGALETFRNLFNQTIQAFKNLQIGEFQNEYLPDLILHTESFINQKLLESRDLSLIQKLGIDEEKFLSMLKKPDGLDLLNEKISQIHRLFPTYKERNPQATGGNIPELLRRFEFDADNKLIIKSEFYDHFKEAAETYISTPAAVNLYEFSEGFIALIKKHHFSFDNSKTMMLFLQPLFLVDEKEIKINPSTITREEGN